MHLSVKRVYFGDFVFIVDENVYEPAEDSFLFAENFEVTAGDYVLDMGAGCGILGILAAGKARGVVSVDINPYSVYCAKENAKLNNVSNKIYCIQGDLFTPLSEGSKFDLILFNAPYLPAEESELDSWIERAWAGGYTGRIIIDRFIGEVQKHLKPTGKVLLLQSTLANVDKTVQRFAEYHLNARVVAACELPFFETVTLIEAKN
jgi:release factor glutamine methyltransferase